MLKIILENITGLEETRLIPYAEDPKNVGIEDESAMYKIFYFIDRKFLEYIIYILKKTIYC